MRAWLIFAVGSFALTCTVYLPSSLKSSVPQVLLVALLSSLTTGLVLFPLNRALTSSTHAGVSFFQALVVFALVGASRALAPIVAFQLPWSLTAPLPSAPSSLFFGALFGVLFLAAIAGVGSTLNGQAHTQEELSARLARLGSGLESARAQVAGERSFLTRVVDSRINPVLDNLLALAPADAPEAAPLRVAAAAELPQLALLLSSPSSSAPPPRPDSPSPFSALLLQLRSPAPLFGWVISVALVMLAPMFLTLGGVDSMAVFILSCLVLLAVGLCVRALARRLPDLASTCLAYAVAIPAALAVAFACTPRWLDESLFVRMLVATVPYVLAVWLAASLIAGLVRSSQRYTRWLEESCDWMTQALRASAADSLRVSHALAVVLNGEVQSRLAAASLALGALAREQALGVRSPLASDVSFLASASEQVAAARLELESSLTQVIGPSESGALDLSSLEEVAGQWEPLLDIQLTLDPAVMEVSDTHVRVDLLLLTCADVLAGACRRAGARRAGIDLAVVPSGQVLLSVIDDGGDGARLSQAVECLLADAGAVVRTSALGVNSVLFAPTS